MEKLTYNLGLQEGQLQEKCGKLILFKKRIKTVEMELQCLLQQDYINDGNIIVNVFPKQVFVIVIS